MTTSSRYKSNTNKKKEKSLIEIIHILYKRKFVIIISVFTLLCLALIYSYTATPIYEAKVVLKKEIGSGDGETNEFYEIVKMQTQDEVETEMALIKTGEVLSKVVEELQLHIGYDKYIDPSGDETELNNTTIDYKNPRVSSTLNFSIPFIKVVELYDEKSGAGYYVKKIGLSEYNLHDIESDELIQSVVIENQLSESTQRTNVISDSTIENIEETEEGSVVFNTDLAKFEFRWPKAAAGSKFYFSINSFFDSIVRFGRQVSIGRIGKTNIFSVAVKANSPHTAMVLANLLVDKFRESRIEQQKQTIRYSFNFVDDQLEEMQIKLREAEDNLSNFKASGQITTIDASSEQVVSFLSTLEAEKMNNELLLAEYRNKQENMRRELQSSGYFDQSFLSPEGPVESNSPFSALLKQLSELELRKLELIQKRTENHPDVINLTEQIKQTEEKLASYNQNTLTAYQIIIKSLEKKQLDIANIMSKYEVKLERLPGQENKLARLIRSKDVYEKMFTLLLDKREEMRIAELSKLQDIVIVDPAREPLKPVSPRKMLNMFIALVLGSLFGVVGIFLIELKNSKLVNLDEIEEEFQVPIFALIPNYPKKVRENIQNASEPKDRLVTMMQTEDGFRESFRLFKAKLQIYMQGKSKIFMITSCEENTGKTSVTANLAIAIAQENRKVLIIDCDLRKSQLSRMFDLYNSKFGLIKYLSDGSTPEISNKVLKNLDILPAGGITENSSQLLNSDKMKSLFNIIDTSIYDYIILDTPPVTRVVDTLVLGRYVRDAILVVRPNLSHKEAVWGGVLEMIQAKIKIRGIIANGAEIKDSYYYKHRYGYGYGYSSQNKKDHSGNGRGKKGSLRKVNSKSFS